MGGVDELWFTIRNRRDDELTFTPEAGFLGSETVTLHMIYPWGSHATQELTLTWEERDTPPGFRLYLPLAMWD